jgi:hypothetical protein
MIQIDMDNRELIRFLNRIKVRLPYTNTQLRTEIEALIERLKVGQ